MPERVSMLAELAEYTGFDDADAAALVEARPVVESAFPDIVDAFYDAIERSPGALRAMREGPAQVDRLKGSLHRWLEGVFAGVYDDAYFVRRARIGRMHVRMELDQRYMFAAMSVLRTALHEALTTRAEGWSGEKLDHTHRAIDRICDIELAIMLETYRETFVTKMRDTERLATLGQLAATIGHELRNPLAVIDTSVHLLRRSAAGDPKSDRHLQRIADQTALSNDIIADLLELARDRDPNREPTRLDTVVQQVLDGLPTKNGVAIEVDLDPALPLAWIDGGQVRQLIGNLLTNAIQSTRSASGDGAVQLAIRADGSDLVLTVDDEGIGLSPDVERRLFEPLFTTRSRGVGLGLALCKRIAEKHRGRIAGHNRPGGGARFEVVLPEAFGGTQ